MNPIKPLQYVTTIIAPEATEVKYVPLSDRYSIFVDGKSSKKVESFDTILQMYNDKFNVNKQREDFHEFVSMVDKVRKANNGLRRVRSYGEAAKKELLHRPIEIYLYSPTERNATKFSSLNDVLSAYNTTEGTIVSMYLMSKRRVSFTGENRRVIMIEDGEYVYPKGEFLVCKNLHIRELYDTAGSHKKIMVTQMFSLKEGDGRTVKANRVFEFIGRYNNLATEVGVPLLKESDFAYTKEEQLFPIESKGRYINMDGYIDISKKKKNLRGGVFIDYNPSPLVCNKDEEMKVGTLAEPNSIVDKQATSVKVGIVKGANRWLPHDAARWMYESEEHMEQGVWVNDFDEYSGWRLVKDPREIYGKHIVVNDGLADATKRSITPIFQEIHIHYDFSTGKEKSLIEVKMCDDPIVYTHCTAFFNTDEKARVIVKRLDGSYIDRDELMSNNGVYTAKEMRSAHNLEKMLRAGALDFKRP